MYANMHIYSAELSILKLGRQAHINAMNSSPKNCLYGSKRGEYHV